VLELLEGGERHRHFGETKMNKNSSRSHTIFRMVVESRSRDANPDDAQVGRRSRGVGRGGGCCCATPLAPGMRHAAANLGPVPGQPMPS